MDEKISDYKIELKRLRESVKGHLGAIADECGLSVPTVSRVLNGDWVNQDVLMAAKKVRDEIKEKEKKLTKLIS